MSKARQLAQKPTQPTGRKNLIINGAMQVAQRGTSFSSTSGIYTLDRIRRTGSSLSTAVITVEQSTDAPDGFSYSYKATTSTVEGAVNADDAYYPVAYKIEAQDLQHLNYGTSNAKAVTVSFWVKSSVAGTYVLQLYSADSVRAAGKTYSISSANTWEYKTLTYNGDTTGGINNDTGVGLEIDFIAGAGSNFTAGTLSSDFEDYTDANWAVGQNVNLQNIANATFQITGLQLEVGSVATEFEHRSYGEELALCQRYYTEFKFPQTTPFFPSHRQTTNTVRSTVTTPVPMRTTPSINTSGQPYILYNWDNGSNLLIDDGTSLTAIGSSLDVNRFTISNPDVTSVGVNVGAVFAYSGTLECNSEL